MEEGTAIDTVSLTDRLEIDGDKGKLVIEGGKLTFTELAVGETEFNAVNKKFMPRIPSKKIKKHIGLLGQAKMFLFEQHTGIINNFVSNILFKTPLIAPGEEGIRGLTISNAIHLSGWTGEKVTLPIDEERYIEELEKRKEEERASAKKKV